MRFRPKGGLGPLKQKHDKEASQARADRRHREQGGNERLFEKRHTQEIERAENVAAGLLPEGAEAAADIHENKEFRQPNLFLPSYRRKFAPVEIKERPTGVLDAIKTAATNLSKGPAVSSNRGKKSTRK